MDSKVSIKRLTELHKSHIIKTQLIGTYQFYNIMLSIAVATHFGIKLKNISGKVVIDPVASDQNTLRKLVGMLKNSSYYNPLRRPELVKSRRDVVFGQMKKNNHVLLMNKQNIRRE